MSKCCLCGRKVPFHSRYFPLCAGCMDQVVALRPELKNYDWFVRALRARIRRTDAPSLRVL